jgi:hypothetical protein
MCRRQWCARVLAALLVCASALFAQGQPRVQAGGPKLVLGIIIDQFRYDYLTRFRDEYTGGIKRMLEEGADFTNARYHHSATVTAVGHSTFFSGATPSISGIIANEWWDRATGAAVTSVSDPRTRLVGGAGPGASPRRMLASTIVDELKASGKGGKAIGISLKDRSAILTSGHTADAAYWFDPNTGNFVTSTFYMRALPGWVADINKTHAADKFAGQEWLKHKLPEGGPELYSELDYTPFGNELVQQMALRALAAEKLGAGPKTDVLTVSYSSNDYVGHRYGPESAEVHDMALRVDKLVGELIQAAEAQAGAGNVITVLTADHGVAPVPEENRRRKMPGGRLDAEAVQNTIELVLEAKYGGAHWVSYSSEAGMYLDLGTVGAHNISVAEVEDAAAKALRGIPHIARVYTHTQMQNGAIQADQPGVAMRNSFNAERSGNLLFIPEPYWIWAATGSTHGTPYDYDTHVPMLFLGRGIRAGRYNAEAAPNDIAPTLATLLDIETPSGSVGRVLSEILK